MHIITSGKPFIDIDAYAGIVAYAELMNLLGQSSQAVTTSIINGSITPTLHDWPVALATKYKPSIADQFTLIDVSNPDFFDPIVDVDRVEALLDHHPGFEDFWGSKLGPLAQIEPVGAACTLVYESWQKAELIDKISQSSARLLACGILDNTLNFKARVTQQRDHEAYTSLLGLADLPQNWPALYFSEYQAYVLSNLEEAIIGDYKPRSLLGHSRANVSQLAIWDAEQLLSREALKTIKDTMSKRGGEWFVSLISISEERNYLICTDRQIQNWLAELLGVDFKGDVATTDRLWLRKEILIQAIKREKSRETN